MRSIVAAGLCLSALSASRATAQHPSSKSAADSVATELVGTWAGQYQTDHAPPGMFTLTIVKDTGWTAKMEMTSGDQPFPTRVIDFTVNGSNVSWTQELMGMTCKGSAVLAAGTLRGETSCDHASVGYVLRKTK